jgi:branched-chain amino acid transport system ATP-binding protein
MTKLDENHKTSSGVTRGHGLGPVDTVLSVDEVEREAAKLACEGPNRADLKELAGEEELLAIEGLRAGYGKMVVLHDFELHVGAGQSLCLIGPNGAGKSTVLHSIYGFTNIKGGAIKMRGQDVTRLNPNEKLKRAGIAYILQDKSVFPGMTVEENMLMGGFLMDKPAQAREAAERVLAKYPRLNERRKHHAGCSQAGRGGSWRSLGR